MPTDIKTLGLNYETNITAVLTIPAVLALGSRATAAACAANRHSAVDKDGREQARESNGNGGLWCQKAEAKCWSTGSEKVTNCHLIVNSLLGLTCLTPGLSRSVDRNLNGFGVDANLWWVCAHCYGQCEALACAGQRGRTAVSVSVDNTCLSIYVLPQRTRKTQKFSTIFAEFNAFICLSVCRDQTLSALSKRVAA